MKPESFQVSSVTEFTKGDLRQPVICELDTCRQCRNALYDVKGTAEQILTSVEQLKLGNDRKQQVVSLAVMRYHQKFRISLSGCPNCCSQPQIKDFGLHGVLFPAVSKEPCVECMACVDECQEGAVRVSGGIPRVDLGKCVQCGACVRVCPTGAISEGRRGVRAIVGGKLGRHPRLAEELISVMSPESAGTVLLACLKFYTDNALAEERFGALIARLGLGILKQAVFAEIQSPRA